MGFIPNDLDLQISFIVLILISLETQKNIKSSQSHSTTNLKFQLKESIHLIFLSFLYYEMLKKKILRNKGK